jgi:hypothetical protein
MSGPIADATPILCDVPGCGRVSTQSTTGSEPDPQGLGRSSIARLNVCDHHASWSHSDDAKDFVAGRGSFNEMSKSASRYASRKG